MGISLYSKHMGTMCKRSNYTPNSPQYEGDCEYRITSLAMFAIVSNMRITGVEISKSQNVQKKLQFRKVSKHCKSHTHCVRHVGIDDLNYVCHS